MFFRSKKDRQAKERKAIVEMAAVLAREKVGWFLELEPYDSSGELWLPVLELDVRHTQPYLDGGWASTAGHLHGIMLVRKNIKEQREPESPVVTELGSFVTELGKLPPDTRVGYISLYRQGLDTIGSAYVDLEHGRLLSALPPGRPPQGEHCRAK